MPPDGASSGSLRLGLIRKNFCHEGSSCMGILMMVCMIVLTFQKCFLPKSSFTLKLAKQALILWLLLSSRSKRWSREVSSIF